MVPFPRGSFEWQLDFTDALDGRRNVLHRLPPIHVYGERSNTMRGWRSDVDGVFSISKYGLPGKRASSSDVVRFQAAMVGFAVASNAVAWDMHVGQVTRVGQRAYDKLDRATAQAA